MERFKKIRIVVLTVIVVVFVFYILNGFLSLNNEKNKNPITEIKVIPDDYMELFKDTNAIKLETSYIFKHRAPITVLTYKGYTINISKVICDAKSPKFLETKQEKISDSNQGVYMPFTNNDLIINYNLESVDDASVIKLNYDGLFSVIPTNNRDIFIFNTVLGSFSIALDKSDLKEIYCKNASLTNKAVLANLLVIKKDKEVYLVLVNKNSGSVLSKKELSNLFADINL